MLWCTDVSINTQIEDTFEARLNYKLAGECYVKYRSVESTQMENLYTVP